MGVAKTYNVLGVFTIIIIANVRAQVFTIVHKKSQKNYTIFIRPESNQEEKLHKICIEKLSFVLK